MMISGRRIHEIREISRQVPPFCRRFAQILTDMFSLSLAIQVGLNALVISITLLRVRNIAYRKDIVRRVSRVTCHDPGRFVSRVNDFARGNC